MVKRINKLKIVGVLELMEYLELEELKELRLLRRKPAYWVHPFLAKREKHCIDVHLLKYVLLEDGGDFQNFCRMTVNSYEALLLLVEKDIEKQDTSFRYAIPARARLAVSLRYLASGDSYRSLEFLTRISRKTISKFLPKVLESIYAALQPMVLKMPTSESDWMLIARNFESLWNFPHTLGALDGKHIRIKNPPRAHSDFYNYKGFFSVVLLALVDAHSRFIYIDVGANGRVSDNTILKNSNLYQSLLNESLNIPPPEHLGSQVMKIPYFFAGDDIFGLEKHLMKPYGRNTSLNTQQQIFNYRLSRARMTVEMAFGRLISRFRVFHRPIEASLSTVDSIIKTSCCLHNYFSKDRCSQVDKETTTPPGIVQIGEQESNAFKHASKIRDTIATYCMTDGDVHFQWKKIHN